MESSSDCINYSKVTGGTRSYSRRQSKTWIWTGVSWPSCHEERSEKAPREDEREWILKELQAREPWFSQKSDDCKTTQQPAGLLALTFPALGGVQLEQHLGSIQEEVLSLNSGPKEVPRKRWSWLWQPWRKSQGSFWGEMRGKLGDRQTCKCSSCNIHRNGSHIQIKYEDRHNFWPTSIIGKRSQAIQYKGSLKAAWF